jgi:hypothetical protein
MLGLYFVLSAAAAVAGSATAAASTNSGMLGLLNVLTGTGIL